MRIRQPEAREVIRPLVAPPPRGSAPRAAGIRSGRVLKTTEVERRAKGSLLLVPARPDHSRSLRPHRERTASGQAPAGVQQSVAVGLSTGGLYWDAAARPEEERSPSDGESRRIGVGRAEDQFWAQSNRERREARSASSEEVITEASRNPVGLPDFKSGVRL